MIFVAIFSLAGAALFLALARSKMFDRYPDPKLGRLSALWLAGLTATLAIYGLLPGDVRAEGGVEFASYLLGGLTTTGSCVSIGIYLITIAPALPERGQIGYSPESATIAIYAIRTSGLLILGLSAAVIVFTILRLAS